MPLKLGVPRYKQLKFIAWTNKSDFSILKFVTVLMSIEDKWNYNVHPSAMRNNLIMPS